MLDKFDSRLKHKCWILAGISLALVMISYGQIQGMKDFPNRREGTNIHPNALEDFVLVAIHRNFKPFPRNAVLNARFFLPKVAGETNVLVQAVELQDSFHYFMQSKNSDQWSGGSWNVFGQWPTKDVIDSLGLMPDNIGVLAQYQIGNQRPVFLPVDVYQSDKELTRKAYTFYFMTGKDLQSLDVSVTNAAGTEVNVQKPQLRCNRSLNPNCRLYAAGSTQAFDLDLSSLAAGEYHLKLVGHRPLTSAVTSLDIVFYHHP